MKKKKEIEQKQSLDKNLNEREKLKSKFEKVKEKVEAKKE